MGRESKVLPVESEGNKGKQQRDLRRSPMSKNTQTREGVQVYGLAHLGGRRLVGNPNRIYPLILN